NPYEGWMRLQKTSGAGDEVDAVLEEPVYLGPFSSRWVQFYPYVLQAWDGWKLSLGRGRGADLVKDLGHPQAGAPPHIILDDPAALGRKRGSLPRFPDGIFPP